MRNSLILKVFVIGFVLMLIIIPLTMIGFIVHERQERQQEAVRSIGNSHAGPQRLLGPVLVMPYQESYSVEETISDSEGRKRKQIVERRFDRARHVMPAELNMAGNMTTEIKRRGIFKAPIYDWQAIIDGKFVLPEQIPTTRARPDSKIVWGKPFVAFGISDMRGISGSPVLEWGKERLSFEKGSGLGFIENGMHALVTLSEQGKGTTVEFRLKLGLRGTERLNIVPLGESNRIHISSTWPHPSFGGRFLPDAATQAIGPEGFKATWSISSLATSASQQFLREAGNSSRDCQEENCLENLEIRLFEPINIYTQSDRALKYGFLFVGITFAAFFLFEVMRRLRIHPAQYFLIGLAQAIFFLLILGLSEHVAFWLAYLAAALASVSLISFYLAFVLHGRWRGAGFGSILGVLFAALYGLLISEDIALMLGSILLFCLLAIIMIVTRHLDWYRIGYSSAEPAGTSETGA